MAGSKHSGIGAIVYDGGVAFRVWAPFAKHVSVVGDFNGWSQDATPLSSEENGYWSADVPSAKEGHKYQYALTTQSDQILRRNDPRALAVTKNEQHSVVVGGDFDWEGDSFTLPPVQNLVVYELHIGTFYRSDPSRSGTFSDATEKLDYLAALGVNAVEIMPITEFSTDGSWGYNPAYLYAVESSYGGRHEFLAFVKAAHKHGIGVILDVVYNHMGPTGVDVWQFDGWSENGKGGIYFYNDDRSITPWGDNRLDFGRPEVRQFITDSAITWLKDCHVDGLRLDSVHFIRNVDDKGGPDIPDGWRLLKDITTQAKKVRPSSLIIAEDLAGYDAITKPQPDGGLGFSAQWDPGLSNVLRDVLDQPKDESRDIGKLQAALTFQFNGEPFQRVIYSESHDADANGHARLPEEITPGHADALPAVRRACLAAALMLTAPGIPMLFQGQEFIEDGFFSDVDPLDWRKTQTHAGIVLLYGDLIDLRRNEKGHAAGLKGKNIAILHSDDTTKVLACHRYDKGGAKDDVIVVANLSAQARTDYVIPFPRAGVWLTRFNSDWKGYCEDFSNTPTPDVVVGSDKQGPVNIGPYSVVILSQEADLV